MDVRFAQTQPAAGNLPDMGEQPVRVRDPHKNTKTDTRYSPVVAFHARSLCMTIRNITTSNPATSSQIVMSPPSNAQV